MERTGRGANARIIPHRRLVTTSHRYCAGVALLRSTVEAVVPYRRLEAFRRAVSRMVPYEYPWRGLEITYVSVVSDGARPKSKVRVLLDSLGEPGDIDQAREAADEVVVRAMNYLKVDSTDTTCSAAVVS